MNERILKLAVQAGAGEWGDSVVPAMMDIEKFAELIIQEYEKLLPEDCVYEEEGPTKGWWIGYAARNHFGIPLEVEIKK